MYIGLMPNWRSNLMYTNISSTNRSTLTRILEEIETYDRDAYASSQQLTETQINAFGEHSMFSVHIANPRVADFLRLPDRGVIPENIELEISSDAWNFSRAFRDASHPQNVDYVIDGLPPSSVNQLHHPTIEIMINYELNRLGNPWGQLFMAIIKDIMTEEDRWVLLGEGDGARGLSC